MSTDLGIIAIVLICFGSVVMTVRLLVNGRIWKKMIENKMLPENMQFDNYSLLENDRMAWLKWGIVITAFSLALIFIQIVPVQLAEELKIGITGLFIGAAFIASHFISDMLIKK